ncbi:uncharacterized protein LOC102717157 [Oryza brachyantha]|uniref:uncharacterized protein LOC102717157 n=1 Tax=Oryza brachyantha TaxID=4533 RepID=UPI001AD960B3|nr:uncharacterized protein LOC102717157 [Oryza brachyantha]XP_040380431.1 uncharacterized protein LOC102717157 [Oryza brachyantha]
MLLRRLLGPSGEVSRHLRCSHSTLASRPAWAMVVSEPQEEAAELRATFRLAEPPRASQLLIPVDAISAPDSQNRGIHAKGESICAVVEEATSDDGLILLRAIVVQAQLPASAQATAPNFPGSSRLLGHEDEKTVARVVCNPLSGQLILLPDIEGTRKGSPGLVGYAGLLTPADRWDGPPDRYVVAEVSGDDFVMHRFLSETGRWDAMQGFLSPLPAARPIVVDQPVVAFGGRLWWIDLAWGAVSVDPFADEPDFRFVELPSGRVLPASNKMSNERRRRKVILSRHRRIGVSEGRLRYVEVSEGDPFVLSSFVLDEEGSCWTMQHCTALLSEGAPFPQMPGIGCINPLNSHLVYIMVGRIVFGVDMEKGMAIGRSVLDEPCWLTPCVLPPWLGSSRIPSTGTLLSKKIDVESKTLEDMLVRVDRCSLK